MCFCKRVLTSQSGGSFAGARFGGLVSESSNDDIDAIEADPMLDGDGGTQHTLSEVKCRTQFS
jgi:hypothetical protein